MLFELRVPGLGLLQDGKCHDRQGKKWGDISVNSVLYAIAEAAATKRHRKSVPCHGFPSVHYSVCERDRPGRQDLLLLFRLTLFLSGALLFLMEPMLAAKMALPKLGGTPAVWNIFLRRYLSIIVTRGIRVFPRTREAILPQPHSTLTDSDSPGCVIRLAYSAT